MLAHMIAQLKPKAANSKDILERSGGLEHCREEILYNIDELHVLSRRGLWGILLFLALSAGILYSTESGLVASIPADIRVIFGEAPPLHLLNIALAVSWLSAFVLILGRTGTDGRPHYSWYNIGLPTAFYPLYIFSDPSGTHFPAVFLAGLVLLIAEHVTVMSYAARAIREETARLKRLQ